MTMHLAPELSEAQRRANEVASCLHAYRYRFTSEAELQGAIEQALVAEGLRFAREVAAHGRDRYDFLVAGDVVIEVKTQGSLTSALSQCLRYAERADVAAVVLATSRFWANSHAIPATLAEKPFICVRLREAL